VGLFALEDCLLTNLHTAQAPTRVFLLVNNSGYVVLDNPVSTSVDIAAGGFSPNSFSITAGSSVIFTNTSGVNQSVTSATAPYTYNSGNFGPGQSYELALVRPGVYQIISTPSGATCTVTVTGTAQSVDSTYSGGGIYRSAMLGNAAAPNARLVYEHEFIDWAGNARVTDAQVALKQTSVGTAFCSGDGSGTACPCGNTGSAGAGCANSASATGAVLAGLGVATVGADSVVLEATDCPANKPGIFFQGANQAAGGNGSPFGDGLLCAAGQIVRLETVFTNAAGLATSTVSLSVSGGVNPWDSPTKRAGEPENLALRLDFVVGSKPFSNCGSRMVSSGLPLVYVNGLSLAAPGFMVFSNEGATTFEPYSFGSIEYH